MDNFTYIPKTRKQLNNWFNGKKRSGRIGFTDFDNFYNWYSESKKVCKYCGLTEEESQEIVMTGLLKSKRFPQNGKIGRGTNRCMWLEIDRWNPDGNYSEENSVLCCYFCNNDKSDVIHGDHYTMFFQNRVGYLRQLLKGEK